MELLFLCLSRRVQRSCDFLRCVKLGSCKTGLKSRPRKGEKKEKETPPGMREVSEIAQMFDARAVFTFTVTGIMLDYGAAAVLFGKVSCQEAEQTVSCSVAALQFSPDLYKGFIISSTRVYFFLSRF